MATSPLLHMPLPDPGNYADEDATRIQQALLMLEAALTDTMPPTATEDLAGLVRLATADEAAGGTATGSVPTVARAAEMVSAALAAKIQRLTVASAVPESLAGGQIAINEADGKLFWRRNSDGAVQSIDLTLALYATQAWVTGQISAAVAGLVNSAPGALDTLKELADALNNDASFAATMTTALAGKVPTTRTVSAGGIATGGGALSDNITITVPKASQSDAEAGTDDAKAMTALRVKDAINALASSIPVGTLITFAGKTAPAGWLKCNGASYNSTSYAALFAALVQTAAVTISIAAPGVVTWTGHPLNVNDPVKFTTTGALPTGLTAGTTYYVHSVDSANTFKVCAKQIAPRAATFDINANTVTCYEHGLTANDPVVFATTGTLPTGLTAGTTYYVKVVSDEHTFTVSATPGGSAINLTGTPSGTHTVASAPITTTGTQSGTHTGIYAPYGCADNLSTFNVPDDRGEFFRGWDDGRGIDPSRAFGSYQAEQYKRHSHTGGVGSQGGYSGGSDGSSYITSTATGNSGGTETRPRNRAYLPCIKY